jgi:heme-degrading monooxygenase HmoA
VAEAIQMLEKEIFQLLRKQKGFQDEITASPPAGAKRAVGISLWDQKESAEAYERSTYAKVLKTMGKVIEGTPQVKIYEVSTSTIHKMTARGTA